MPAISIYGISKTRDLTLSGIRRLEVSSFNGRISVTVSRDSPKLTETYLGQVEVRLEVIGDLLRISAARLETPVPDEKCKMDLSLRLPPGMVLTLRTDHGDVQLQGETLGVKAHTVNGSIHLENAGEGDFALTAEHGDILLTDAGGTVRAHCDNGSVHLERFSFQVGSENRVSTGNGALRVTAAGGATGLETSGEVVNGQLTLEPGEAEHTRQPSLTGARFTLRQPGPDRARLEVQCQSGTITVRR